MIKDISSLDSFSLTARIRSTDNDELGLLFHFSSLDDMYWFGHRTQGPALQFLKFQGGILSSLWKSDSFSGYTNGVYYKFEIRVSHCRFQGYVDELLQFTLEDADCLSPGAVGVYSHGNQGSYYRDVAFRTADFRSSIACPAGYHQPATGSSSCIACPAGTFADTTGSANCSACTPGTFASSSASPVASMSTHTPVHGKGCSGYIHMDDYSRYGVQGGSTTVEQCAAAVKALDGREGCRGEYFFFEYHGYCNCPTDDCELNSENTLAGGSGQLYMSQHPLRAP
eukprot:g1137.t1